MIHFVLIIILRNCLYNQNQDWHRSGPGESFGGKAKVPRLYLGPSKLIF